MIGTESQNRITITRRPNRWFCFFFVVSFWLLHDEKFLLVFVCCQFEASRPWLKRFLVFNSYFTCLYPNLGTFPLLLIFFVSFSLSRQSSSGFRGAMRLDFVALCVIFSQVYGKNVTDDRYTPVVVKKWLLWCEKFFVLDFFVVFVVIAETKKVW